MIATISKDFTFSAAHHLDGLPLDHQCSRAHGHNYIVRVELTGPVDDVGMVLDYGDLGFVGAYLDGTFDHRDLNAALPDLNPTAEHLAAHLCEQLAPSLGHLELRVGVSETPKTWAWVTA